MLNKKMKFTGENILLLLILVLSAILNFANLGIEGNANTFYAAGVKSMMMNFKNFFFASFDPAGFVTIDKPPVGFWIQTISAKIFGFSGWSIILPQALAGVISVGIIYHIVKRSFGTSAGLIAALCLAVTPISVAAGRNNTIDNLLVLPLLLACWAALIAAEKGKTKYLMLSLVLVGIGFNIKMVEAYMVAPAIYITYLLASNMNFKKKIRDLVLGTVVLLVVSLSWAVAVDLIPAGSRPYIGSSTNNTVMQLIIGHNGLERIGLGKKIAGRSQKQQGIFKSESSKNNNRNRINTSNKNMQYAGGGQAGMRSSSNSGIFRLFAKGNMSDQISWLLLFAIIGFVAASIQEKLKAPFDNKRKLSLILWIMWLLPEFIYFSFSKNITHTYYLTTMAPSIAALTGIGLSAMYEFYKKGESKSWILPIALIANGCAEMLILSYNYNRSNGYRIIILVTGILCIVSSIILCMVNLTRIKRESSYKGNTTALSKVLISAAFTGVLIAPTVWSFTPMFYKMNGSSPSAGLELASSNEQRNSGTGNNSKLIKFLENNKTNEKYLVAVPSANSYGSDLILKTGEPVMAIGGFSGSDPILTVEKFKKLVDSGALRYALVNTDNNRGFGGAGGNNSNNNIMNWIKENGKVVPNSKWNNSNTSKSQEKNQRFNNGAAELYDLKR
ncbi:4-amino-4-deoxy-L-arabinose transferase-like glycosyltransferase [Clostridium algifaecis]|uniref:4-amino-4-deoxy-L-arabinose transferase-like glycosyltransferase n=1 Tax=Clostridium algifaecis TaxID=1472040 RepID=A0ABS4KTA3_9CLOT|nr:4-amino-4-deoxy-L-arabinose transferase-like glycosyltransferase [Clostridium algifaecis]